MNPPINAINLWECLTAGEINHRRDRGARGPHITEDDLCLLGMSGRWNAQELSLTATNEGWLIKVFSCYDDYGLDHSGVEILIPSDRSQPVKILKDQAGKTVYLHD